MATRQFAKRILRRDLTLLLPSGRRVILPRSSEFSSVAWVTRGEVDDGFETLLRSLARPGTAFFDVGAHFGFYSVYLADLHSPIVAFEPDERIHPSLLKNLSGIPSAKCVKAAVSDHCGKMQFLFAAAAPQSRLLDSSLPVAPGAVAEIDVTTVDAVWRDMERPDVGSVKIDTEGHESEVLGGAREMIAACRPQLLIEATATSLASHAQWLAALDYRAVILSNRRHGAFENVVIVTPDDVAGRFNEGMILFVPPSGQAGSVWKALEGGVLAR